MLELIITKEGEEESMAY